VVRAVEGGGAVTSHALAGRRVLVTRAPDDAQSWARRLAVVGAETLILSCVQTEPFDDEITRARLVAACREIDWLVLTSARGAEAVHRAGVRLAESTCVAAVGEATELAVRSCLARAPLVARGGTSRALGGELLALWGERASAQRVVVAAAEGGLVELDRTLAQAGARVTRVNVYRTVPAPPITPRRDLEQEGISDVLLASPSAVTGLLNQALVGPTTRIFTIGPTTSAAATAAGLVVTGESATPTFNGLLEAMQCTIGA